MSTFFVFGLVLLIPDFLLPKLLRTVNRRFSDGKDLVDCDEDLCEEFPRTGSELLGLDNVLTGAEILLDLMADNDLLCLDTDRLAGADVACRVAVLGCLGVGSDLPCRDTGRLAGANVPCLVGDNGLLGLCSSSSGSHLPVWGFL